jgi:hypothetical protein
MPVRAPVASPPHKFGLFSVALIQEDADAHTLGGVEYQAVCSTRVDPYPVACETTVPPELLGQPKETDTTTGITVGTPFGLYAGDSCVLGRTQPEARSQLRARFLAGEQATVERVVFSGELGNVPNLIEATVLASPAAPDLPDAVGLLEQWLATTTGGVGIIHAPRWLAPRAFLQVLALTAGPRAMTVLGSSWAFGTGYPGSAPAGQSADTALWLYATPPVTVRRSGLIEPADWASGGFDREQNLGLLLEERLYVVDWPCMSVAAIKTSLTRPGPP